MSLRTFELVTQWWMGVWTLLWVLQLVSALYFSINNYFKYDSSNYTSPNVEEFFTHIRNIIEGYRDTQKITCETFVNNFGTEIQHGTFTDLFTNCNDFINTTCKGKATEQILKKPIKDIDISILIDEFIFKTAPMGFLDKYMINLKKITKWYITEIKIYQLFYHLIILVINY